MFRYAQTILQLNNQVRKGGYSIEDQSAVINAYALAAELFSARFRGSGKTFISHLVGTASILAAHQAPVHVVIAGLMHAAYEQGDFGHGFRRGSTDDQVEMIAAIGSDAEKLVRGYGQLPWTSQAIRSYVNDIAELSEFQREVLFIRMANELEDHLDCNALYSRDRQARMQRLHDLGEVMVRLTRELGVANLAKELDEVFTENQTEDVYHGLPTPGTKSHLVPPRSFRRRYDNRLRTDLGRWRRAILRS